LTNIKKEVKEKKKEIERLMDHNKRLIADKKAALDEARANEIGKDKHNSICQQIKTRMDKNTDQDKKIDANQKEIQDMKKYIQNLIDQYQQAKTDRDRKITMLQAKLDEQELPPAEVPPSRARRSNPPKNDQNDPGS